MREYKLDVDLILIFSFTSLYKKKVSYPSHIDLSRPETLGLYATRNFYLSYSDTDENKVKIGVWQIIPNYIVKQFHRELKIRPKFARNLTILSDNQTKLQHIILDDKFDLNNYRQKESFFEEIIRKSNDPIVIYFHGNTGTRANGHRVELYGQLRKMEYHIFAIDYRGFADSSEQSPTEKGCVSDALAIYKYIKNLTKNPIYIYGHALGIFSLLFFLKKGNLIYIVVLRCSSSTGLSTESDGVLAVKPEHAVFVCCHIGCAL